MGNARALRRLRRFLPYPLIGVALYWLRPLEWRGDDDADLWLDLGGLTVALAGEGLRFWTWGANAEAGLFGLRHNGPYELLRHPLYVGNLLIVGGMLLIFNNPIAYALVLPAFVVLYNVIARKEEYQLLRSGVLGDAYRGYMQAHPNRFLPDVRRRDQARVAAHPFAWNVAVEKEYESVVGILVGWIALDLYEEVLVWRSSRHGSGMLFFELALLVVLGHAALAFYVRKQRRRARLAAQLALPPSKDRPFAL